MPIYRATRNPPGLVQGATTRRPPRNVPFYVDNIWEWLRPPNFPSRRISAFASPQAELAANSAGCHIDQAYRVALCDQQPVCQLVDVEDARHHRDINSLKRVVLSAFKPEWFSLPHTERGRGAALFLPCATAEEVELAMEDLGSSKAEAIRTASTFWGECKLINSNDGDVSVDGSGEVFFEGTYRLHPR